MTPAILHIRKFCFSLLVLFLLVCSHSAFACRCVSSTLLEDYSSSDFVAKIKLLKITPDPANEEYHDAKIEVISLYKGTMRNTIKIRTALRTSCAFNPKENTTWIIFARQSKDLLSTNLCSGNLAVYERKEPNITPKASFGGMFKPVDEILAFFSQNKITKDQYHGVEIRVSGLEFLRGFKNNNAFSVFQFDVNPDLSVTKVTQLQKFENRRLNRAVMRLMKKSAKVYDWAQKLGPSATKIYAVVYFYPHKGILNSYLQLESM